MICNVDYNNRLIENMFMLSNIANVRDVSEPVAMKVVTFQELLRLINEENNNVE